MYAVGASYYLAFEFSHGARENFLNLVTGNKSQR